MPKRPDQHNIDQDEAGSTDYKFRRQSEAGIDRLEPNLEYEPKAEPGQLMDTRRRQSERDRAAELQRARGTNGDGRASVGLRRRWGASGPSGEPFGTRLGSEAYGREDEIRRASEGREGTEQARRQGGVGGGARNDDRNRGDDATVDRREPGIHINGEGH